MTWPGWGDILPSVTMLATIAALLWAVGGAAVHQVRPVAERAASEAEKRSAASTRIAVDELYERLKGNDFRHVEDRALEGPRTPARGCGAAVGAACGGRAASDRPRSDPRRTRIAVDELYERLKGNDFRHVEDGLKGLGDRIDEARKEFGQRLDGVETQLGARLDRARQDRKDMEGRLIAAIAGKPLEGP